MFHCCSQKQCVDILENTSSLTIVFTKKATTPDRCILEVYGHNGCLWNHIMQRCFGISSLCWPQIQMEHEIVTDLSTSRFKAVGRQDFMPDKVLSRVPEKCGPMFLRIEHCKSSDSFPSQRLEQHVQGRKSYPRRTSVRMHKQCHLRTAFAHRCSI